MWYHIHTTPAIESYDETILTNLSETLSPEATEGILCLGFSDQQRQTMKDLAEKARSGELTAGEYEEAISAAFRMNFRVEQSAASDNGAVYGKLAPNSKLLHSTSFERVSSLLGVLQSLARVPIRNSAL